MKSRAFGIVITIILLGALFAVWGLRGVAVYLGIKIGALVLLGLLWTLRRGLAARNR